MQPNNEHTKHCGVRGCGICDTTARDLLSKYSKSGQPNNTQEWKTEFKRRFVLTHTPEGLGVLFDIDGQQTVDEVIMVDYIEQLLSHQKKTIRESIENIIITGNRQEPMEAQAKFRNLVLSLPSLTIPDEE